MFEAGGQEGEGKRAELDSSPTVEFILKLHPEEETNSCCEQTTMRQFKALDGRTFMFSVVLPVQPEGMKECRQPLHHQEDGHSENGEQAKHGYQEQNPQTGVHP